MRPHGVYNHLAMTCQGIGQTISKQVACRVFVCLTLEVLPLMIDDCRLGVKLNEI